MGQRGSKLARAAGLAPNGAFSRTTARLSQAANVTHKRYGTISQLANDEIGACEALLRWRRDDGSLGEPTGLLEFASRSGRMYDLSIWVLRTTLDEAVRWRDAGTSVPVAVNLSSRDVLHPGLANLIRAELQSK